MKPVLSAETAKYIDSLIINDIMSSSGLLMMENAARSAYEIIIDRFPNLDRILLLCGVGNNGGDGFALARHLSSVASCTIYYIGSIDKMSPETYQNMEFAKANNVRIFHISSEGEILKSDFAYDCIVDCLMGVGGSENLKGLVVPMLEKANSVKCVKVAIDVPSGLNCTNGNYHSAAFNSDLTITMFANKRAFLNKSLKSIVGEVVVANLGVNLHYAKENIYEWEIEGSDINYIMPAKLPSVSKFDCGRIGFLAGSEKYPGAAAIAANAAVASGAGLVHLFTTSLHHSLMPEVIPTLLSKNEAGGISSENFENIIDDLKKCDVVAIGPGIGRSNDTYDLIIKIINELKCKIIIDADALRLCNALDLNNNFVLTPHIGEFSFMANKSIDEINSDRFYAVNEYAKIKGCNILLKGSTTIVSNGDMTYYSNSGNSGLASGGSGDALTGMIAAFSANSETLIEAAAMAAYIHGLAGDIYTDANSAENLSASKLIDYIGKAIKVARSEN